MLSFALKTNTVPALRYYFCNNLTCHYYEEYLDHSTVISQLYLNICSNTTKTSML